MSDFADDPEMEELIVYFLEQLEEHVARLGEAVEQGDAPAIGVVAHQLKGSGAGYGFGPITNSAAALEDAIRAGEAEVEALREKIEDLILVCQRAAASGEQTGN